MMILLIIFLSASIFLGYVISKHFKFLESIFEKAAFTLVTGLTIGTFACFAFSSWQQALNEFSILMASLFCLIAAIFLIQKNHIKITKPKIAIGKAGIAEIAVLIVFLLIAYFNSYSIYEDKDGSISSIWNSWADYALHVGIINSFALRDNYPPIYPNLAGAPMRYPFLVDFLSAIMVKEGVPLAYSITMPNLAFIFGMVSLAYAFFKRLTGKRKIAAIAMILFFFNGNLGFQYFLEDFNNAPDKAAFLDRLPKAYSNIPDQHIEFMNLTYSVFIPQRAALMGFPIVMIILAILWRILRNEAENREYLLAGALIGLLPLVHASSFGVAAFMAFAVCGYKFIKRPTVDNRVVLLLIPLLAIALPQLLFINQQSRVNDFAGIQLGWVSGAKTSEEFVNFWWQNLGIVMPFGLAGMLLLKRDQLLFALPFALLFVLSNIFRFQPWGWDNIKVLMYWFLIFAAQAATGIYAIFETVRRRSALIRTAAIVLIFALIITSIFSGLLTFYAWNKSNAVMWSKADLEVGKFVSSTEPDAVFLTADKHNHIAYTIGGRQILAGYAGHLWSHGLNSAVQVGDMKTIFTTADENLIKKWNVRYIYFGWAELNELGAHEQLFRTPKFLKVYENHADGVRIYKYLG